MRNLKVPVGLLTVVGALLAFSLASGILAQHVPSELTGLRGSAPLGEDEQAPRIPMVEETDRRRTRNYPEQPPTIPHKIDGYQVDMNSNRCLACHARARVSESGAPMISITHFMDRDGQFLAAVSPRRYFCNQCHVVQADTPVPIDNSFVDIDSLLSGENGTTGN